MEIRVDSPWPGAILLTLSCLALGCGDPTAAPELRHNPVGGAPAAPTAGPELLEDFTGSQVFPASNWWNLEVTSAPVDSDSEAYIVWISGVTPQNPNARRRLHPDFGPPPYGIPYIGVGDDEPLSQVHWTLYGSQSDDGAPGAPDGYPIPDEAITLANWVEGGEPGGGCCGDRHLILVDRDRWLLFETWATEWNDALGRWEAGSGAVFDLSTNDRRPDGWTSADAAGLAIFPGLIKVDEADGPGPITHAFRFTTRDTNGYVWPASHEAGDNPLAPPMGARLRLKSDVNISGFTPELQRVFQAMKTYGLILADNGSDMCIQGTMDPRWDNDVLNPAFHSLYADQFEMLELGWNPTTSGIEE